MAENFDAIIVLGAGITRKGNLTRVAKSRVNRAIELYRSGSAPRIIVTGKNEAAAIKGYAVRKGVNAEDVFEESESLDTIGNAFFTKKNFLLPNNWRSIIVVTSIFHVSRAKFIFCKVLGKSYKAKFVSAVRVLSDKAFREKVIAERGLAILTRLLGTLIADGDMEAIENFLRNSPIYKVHKGLSGL